MLLGLCQSQPAASLGSLVFRSITDVCFPEFFFKIRLFLLYAYKRFPCMLVCAPHMCLLGIELQMALSHPRWVQLLAAELSFQHLLYFYFFG